MLKPGRKEYNKSTGNQGEELGASPFFQFVVILTIGKGEGKVWKNQK